MYYVAGLSSGEQLWLAQRINEHIERLTGNKPPDASREQFQRRVARERRIALEDESQWTGLNGPGVFGGRTFGGAANLDAPTFWDDDDDDD